MFLHFLLTLVNTLSVYCLRPNLAPTHLFVMRVGPCHSTSVEYKVFVSEMSIKRDLYDFSISGDMNITEDIPNGWKIIGTMEKCTDIRNLETCDYFQLVPMVGSGCAGEDSAEMDVYTLFFYYTQPRLTCPIKAGNYKIHNYPFFTENNYLSVAETKISTSLFGYTLKLEAFVEDKKVLCTDVVLQLLYIRDYNWDVVSKSSQPDEDQYTDLDTKPEGDQLTSTNDLDGGSGFEEVPETAASDKNDNTQAVESGNVTEPNVFMIEEDGDPWKKLVVM